MGIITEYLKLQEHFEKKYGNKTVLLYQIGSFYEVYEYNIHYCIHDTAKIDAEGKEWSKSIGKAIEISTVLNCFLTQENNNEPYGIRNPHKLGFPVIAYEKNKNTLLANDYFIVRMDQDKGAAKGNITRSVAEVCSPTMNIENIGNSHSNNIICIYIEYQKNSTKLENFIITSGISVLDVITGRNMVTEFYSKNEEHNTPLLDIYRFLCAKYPKEILIYIKDLPKNYIENNSYSKFLEQSLELHRFNRVTFKINEVPDDFLKVNYQKEFLNKLFGYKSEKKNANKLTLNIVNKSNDRIIEEIGLDKMNYGRISYMCLLSHCYNHDMNIVSNLPRPDMKWLDDNKHLILAHNALIQLDVFPLENKNKKKEIDSLVSVLDKTETNLGKRMLYNMLQNPMLDGKEISDYYDMVEQMFILDDNMPLWQKLENKLKLLPDLGKLHRKLEIKTITPKEIGVLYKAYLEIINVYILLLKYPVISRNLLTQSEIDNFNQFISYYTNFFLFSSLECCHIESSNDSNAKYIEFSEYPIRRTIFKEMDDHNDRLVVLEKNLNTIIEHLNSFISHTTGQKITLKSANKKQGATKKEEGENILAVTNAKANILTNAAINTDLCGVVQLIAISTTEKMIYSDKISNLCMQINDIKKTLKYKLFEIYENVINDMNTKYTFYTALSNMIAKIDLLHCYAKISVRYKYYRPIIVDDDCPTSFLEMKELRHPIIERIISSEYITNDIGLGRGNLSEDRTNGLALFGLNASGKTSLAKAIALNIIMAQCGMFVPCKLKYKPYTKIITRLSGNDNIFTSQSTFEIEMQELRTILKQADERTLTVANELAHGTETTSAIAITVSAILDLIDKDSTFLFATHMHQITSSSFINKLDGKKLKISHLSVAYDATTDNLIYERKLQNGQGDSTYGIIVAKYLGLPHNFIERCYDVINEVANRNSHIVNTTKSKYNASVYVDICAICGKNGKERQLHTHHLKEQLKADKNGMIGHMHKNTKDNLIILCENCHTDLHSSNKQIESVKIPNGSMLMLK